METPDTFHFLDNPQVPLFERKEMLRRFLVKQVELYRQHPDDGEDIAYGIAGMMATQTARELPDDDPYDVILGLAGELELPERHHGPSTSWEKLIELVEGL